MELRLVGSDLGGLFLAIDCNGFLTTVGGDELFTPIGFNGFLYRIGNVELFTPEDCGGLGEMFLANFGGL